MQFSKQLSIASLFLFSSLIFPGLAMPQDPTAAPPPAPAPTTGCPSCTHNNDAGRWDDSESPADRLASICSTGGGCYQATIGQMCVTGDLSQCGCAVSAANAWQSWHGNWFLWSAVNCGGLSVTID